MALVKSKTLIFERTAGVDHLENPQLTALLASGWRIVSSKPHSGETRLQVKLQRDVETRIATPDSGDGVVWQGRPPFPGTLKQMPNNPRDRFTNRGAIRL